MSVNYEGSGESGTTKASTATQMNTELDSKPDLVIWIPTGKANSKGTEVI